MTKIKKLCKFGENNWEGVVEKAINLSPHRALGTSPYIMRFKENPSIGIKGINLNTRIKIDQIEKEYQRRRKAYNKEIIVGKKRVERNLQIGSPVLIFKNPPGNKLKAKWHQGYKIKEFIGTDAYLVRKDGKDYRLNKVHVKSDTSKLGKEVLEIHVNVS